MNNFNKNLVSLAKIVVLGLAVGVFTSYAMANWTEPPANPPANNAPEPLNVTNAGQVKVGGLTINSGGAATGILVPEGDIKFDLPGSKMLFLGTSTEPATTTNHNLRVYGNVNADYYCDRDGANCYTSSQMYGNGGSGPSGTSTDEKVKINSTDATSGYLSDELIAGSGITLTATGTTDIKLTIASSATDEKVKASSTDPTAGYLADKIQNSIAIATNKIQLLNDQATPGNNKCYGANASGTKGWFTCNIDNTTVFPSGGGFISNGTTPTNLGAGFSWVSLSGGHVDGKSVYPAGGYIYKDGANYKASLFFGYYVGYTHKEFTLSTSWQGVSLSPNDRPACSNLDSMSRICARINGSNIEVYGLGVDIGSRDSISLQYLKVN